jgi:hypothetical protein
MNERGNDVGFNDVWAPDMKEARRRAKLRETKAHWALWNPTTRKYETVPNKVENGNHCFYMDGMYINPKSFKKATYDDSEKMDRLAHLLTC